MNREEQRFQAAVAAMQGLCSNPHEGLSPARSRQIAGWSVVCADALLAELDRTKPEPEKLEPDDGGWIPHRPGDPMPCNGSARVAIKTADGFIDGSESAEFWAGDLDGLDLWRAIGLGKHDSPIIAWKPV